MSSTAIPKALQRVVSVMIDAQEELEELKIRLQRLEAENAILRHPLIQSLRWMIRPGDVVSIRGERYVVTMDTGLEKLPEPEEAAEA